MPTILFLHGWGGNADSFAPISQYFARLTAEDGTTWRVLTPHFACPPKEVYTLDDYVNDLESYLQTYQVKHCIVVAHSFGARLVAIMNARHPKLFNKIVITGGAGIKPRWNLWVWLQIRWSKICRRLGWRAPRGSADYRQLNEAGKQTFRNVVNRDLSPELRTISAPTLLIWGARDRATPLSHCRRFRRLIPHAQTIIYRRSGHFAYLTQSARFIRDLQNFCQGENHAS